MELLQKGLTLSDLNPQSSADGQTLTYDAQVNGRAAIKIDQDKILKDVLGMSEDSIRAYFKNAKEVESARVVLSPFWVKNIPKDPQKVKIILDKD